MRRIVLFVVILGCSKSEHRMERRDRMERREAAPSAKVAPSAAKAPSADIPAWASIEIAEGEPAKPVAWVPDGRPTLAVFSASWCPGCTASALADRRLVGAHGKEFQIGVALQDESDEAFTKSPYARALSGVPVWSEASVGALMKACRPRVIPSACLIEKERVAWTGHPAEAGAVIDAHEAGKLEAWVAGNDDDSANRLAQEALTDSTKIPEVVAATHGRVGWQNSVAWDLVDRDNVSPGAAALAVALSRDAVAADGGIDFAHLDTYALALAKAGRIEDAAYVGNRVLAVCAAVQGNCSEEKRRALELIARATSPRGGP